MPPGKNLRAHVTTQGCSLPSPGHPRDFVRSDSSEKKWSPPLICAKTRPHHSQSINRSFFFVFFFSSHFWHCRRRKLRVHSNFWPDASALFVSARGGGFGVLIESCARVRRSEQTTFHPPVVGAFVMRTFIPYMICHYFAAHSRERRHTTFSDLSENFSDAWEVH